MIDNLLLGIGAMKAGTTWLFSHLSKYPEVFFSPEKEIHYFSHLNGKHTISEQMRIRIFQTAMRELEEQPDFLAVRRLKLEEGTNLPAIRRLLSWYFCYLDPTINDSWYINLFRDRAGQKYCADFSNTYAFLDVEGWRPVRQLSQNLKVIYTLRDPVKRFWSHTRFHAKFTGQSPDFGQWGVEDFQAYIDANRHLLLPGRYAQTIRTLRAVLDASEYLVLYVDEIEQRPGAVVQRLERFLGLTQLVHAEEDLAEKVNETEGPEIPAVFLDAIRDYVIDELDALDAVGLDVPEAWRNSLYLYA